MSLLPYFGSKKYLSNEIVNMLEQHKFSTYLEPFFGSGAVYFNLHEKNPNIKCIVNDLSYNIFQFWKNMQNKDFIFKILTCPIDTACYNDEIAFWFEKKYSYYSRGKTINFRKENMNKLIDINVVLKSWRALISNFVIYHLDYEEFIHKFAGFKDSVIYCDPPYVETEKLCTDEIFDHERFHKIAEQYKNQMLISYNDCELIRKLYSDWDIQEIDVHRNSKHDHDHELLIKCKHFINTKKKNKTGLW